MVGMVKLLSAYFSWTSIAEADVFLDSSIYLSLDKKVISPELACPSAAAPDISIDESPITEPPINSAIVPTVYVIKSGAKITKLLISLVGIYNTDIQL